jgi:hypothetical protein
MTTQAVETVPPGLIEAIRRHPRFPGTMRQSAAAIIAAHDRNGVLNRLISDRGRVLFGILALSLHFDGGGGLTPSRMAELCEQGGICSRGRVKALLLLLRWAGHLVPAEEGNDQRRRPLAPTAQMMAAYRTRWRGQLELIGPMVPEASAVARGLDRPDVFASFALALGSAIRGGFRVLDHGGEALAPVADRDNGLLVLLRIALSGPADGPMPPTVPVTVTVADLAAGARVSRSHVLNVLRDAERAGLITRDTARGPTAVIACRPLLAESLAGFFAATHGALAAAAIAVSDRASPSLSG